MQYSCSAGEDRLYHLIRECKEERSFVKNGTAVRTTSKYMYLHPRDHNKLYKRHKTAIVIRGADI